MAAATIPDWISSSSFTEYTDLATKKSSTLISSGAMETDSELSDFLATSGDTITARFAIDLTGDSDGLLLILLSLQVGKGFSR